MRSSSPATGATSCRTNSRTVSCSSRCSSVSSKSTPRSEPRRNASQTSPGVARVSDRRRPHPRAASAATSSSPAAAASSGSFALIAGCRAYPRTANRRARAPCRCGSARPVRAALPCARACATRSPSTESTSRFECREVQHSAGPPRRSRYAYQPIGSSPRRTSRRISGRSKASTSRNRCSSCSSSWSTQTRRCLFSAGTCSAIAAAVASSLRDVRAEARGTRASAPAVRRPARERRRRERRSSGHRLAAERACDDPAQPAHRAQDEHPVANACGVDVAAQDAVDPGDGLGRAVCPRDGLRPFEDAGQRAAPPPLLPGTSGSRLRAYSRLRESLGRRNACAWPGRR